jgi:hypothetical protein
MKGIEMVEKISNIELTVELNVEICLGVFCESVSHGFFKI